MTAGQPRPWRRLWLGPLAAFLQLAAVLELTAIDRRITDLLFFDAGSGRFTWADSWWSNQLIHAAGRDAIVLVFVAAAGIWIASWRIATLRWWRRSAAFVALSIPLATGLVGTGKSLTNVDCPRDLDPYGGDRPYVRLLGDKPDDLPRGRCFPGGHSSGGFALLSLFFVLDERCRRLGWLGLACGLAVGSAFAVGQWARGAHFVSHDLWSAAICWFALLALYQFGFGGRLRPAP